MMKTFRKRVNAVLVSAVMTATSLAVTSAGGFVANAVGKTYSPNKTLVTAIPDPDNPDTPTNQKDCTFMCKSATDEWTTFTDTTGSGPEDLFGTDIKTLQLNFKAEELVTNFSYYFGCSADKAHGYYYDGGATECTPYATEFSVVIQVPSYADLSSAGKFQVQNCYTGLASYDEATKTVSTEEEAAITLVSIEANGTTDTGNGTKPDWLTSGPDPSLEKGVENTGGLYYSSANGAADNYTFKDNGNGTATVTAINSLKIEDLDYVLTPGEDNSEDYYKLPENGGYSGEDEVRKAGLPINSHKFSYIDFGFNPGTTVSSNAKVKSLSVTLQSDQEVSRVMYGGGLNVEGHSAADTEYAKVGKIEGKDPNAGYWYNDMGPEALQECVDKGVEFGINVGGGTDLAKQNLGSYFTVTWDVPEEVFPYATAKTGDKVSFQLWYGEAVAEKYTRLESATIVDATLTYEETFTFPYTASATAKGGQAKIGEGGTVEIPYADFNMNYETTADVYAILFDITTDADVNQMVIGAGTSVLDKCSAATSEYWYQADDANANGKLVLLNWEPTTAGNRPDPDDAEATVAEYQPPTGKKTYTFMWVMPGNVAQVSQELDGKIASITNHVSTENEGDNVKLGVWYAGLGESTASNFTISNVTAYYMADDTRNSAKKDMFEATLEATPSELSLTYNDQENPDADKGSFTVNVSGCSVSSSNSSVVSVSADNTDKTGTKFNVFAKAVSDEPVIITITSPGGQTATVTVNVTEASKVTTTTEATTTTEEVTTTTASKTTESNTTASTQATTTTAATTKSGETTTTEPDYKANALYGDVNLDGRVELADVVLLNKAVAGSVKLEGQAKENSDCQYDSIMDANDSMALLQFLVHLLDQIGPSSEA